MATPDQSPLFETVRGVFAAENWAFEEIPGRGVVKAGFEAHHSRVELHVQVFPELSALSVVSESPLAVSDPARRERLAELAMRVNQTLTVGGFEMNWDAGRLIFRATNVFTGEAGDPSIVRGLIHTTLLEMDRVAPLVMLLSQAEGPQLAGLDLPALLSRLDRPPDSAAGPATPAR
ncbi:MAG: YbjN domain-containing protein [Verrucomicrobiae bacterium]|nr:YbjN domain-containing protein [Verrucomicrobiae bacterium]MCP5539181.1 YbjN domain-containing protein [Akkermansiaceae bacterium]MCP5549832.1 YbjN domain-containing protein [Akkermansiaceae bacterium]